MKSPSTHLIIAAIVSAAMLAGYAGWYVTVSNKSGAVADLRSQIATASDAMGRVSSARAALAEIAGDEAAIAEYFVSETEVVGFINELETRGAEQKATVDVLSVSTNKSAVHPALVLALSVEGGFDAVMRTVGRIEYAPYDVAITTFSIAKTGKDGWRADFTIEAGSAPTKKIP